MIHSLRNLTDVDLDFRPFFFLLLIVEGKEDPSQVVHRFSHQRCTNRLEKEATVEI